MFAHGLGKSVDADRGPYRLKHEEPELKWAERQPGQNAGAHSVQDVVERPRRIHPVELMADVGDQDEERAGERCDLGGYRDLHAAIVRVRLLHVALAESRFQLRQHALAYFFQRALQRKSTGAIVAAAAERLGNRTHADVPLAAQAHAPAPAFDLAEE